jgi:hypothetical protein
VLFPHEIAHLPDSISKFIENCFKRIQRFHDTKKAIDTNLAFKIIRHAYVRNEKIVPHRCTWDMHGWVYPQFFPYTENFSEVVKLLEFMTSQGILSNKFHNKTFYCSQCQCAFLSFREACPHCGSINLNLDDIVHHFPCAYIGPQVDFLQDNKLVCPKCDKELRHIGVDYDKPSTVYSCKDCAHNCQEPSVSTECFHCGRNAAPNEITLCNINSYSLTTLGENAAIYGMDSLFCNCLNKNIQTVTLDIFKYFLSIENNRIKRYKISESTLVYFSIKNLDDIYIKLGSRASAIFNELSLIIYNIIRKTDLLTIVNDFLFLILLVETPILNSKHVVNRIENNIASLFQGNMKLSVNTQAGVLPITGEEDSDEMITKAVEDACR